MYPKDPNEPLAIDNSININMHRIRCDSPEDGVFSFTINMRSYKRSGGLCGVTAFLVHQDLFPEISERRTGASKPKLCLGSHDFLKDIVQMTICQIGPENVLQLQPRSFKSIATRTLKDQQSYKTGDNITPIVALFKELQLGIKTRHRYSSNGTIRDDGSILVSSKHSTTLKGLGRDPLWKHIIGLAIVKNFRRHGSILPVLGKLSKFGGPKYPRKLKSKYVFAEQVYQKP